MQVCIGKTKILSLLLFLIQSSIYANSGKIVTNSPRWDGFGSQFLCLIGSVINAELHNCIFEYTPFTKMEHNYTNDPKYLEKKEWLINFIGNFTIAKPNTPYAQCNYHHEKNGGKVISESKSLKKIKKIFQSNKDIKNYLDTERFNIAVHVRRPNSHDNRLDGADTPDHTFLEIIAALRRKYKDKNPLFLIFSQGKNTQFKQYETNDTILRLNESIEDTFTSMVFADVLVAARSAMSYVAGLLSEGTVYYIPFSCKPLPHWILAFDLLGR